MPPVIWTEEANADLDHITAYIGQHECSRPANVYRVAVRSDRCASELHRGVPRVGPDGVEALRVLHARQQYP